MTDVKLALRGLRGESFADVARRVGDFGGLPVPPEATDSDVLDLMEDRVAELVAASGFSLIAPVRAATTENITLSGAQTIDGVAVVATDRVLAKNQTSPAENGIWVASAGAWSRASDFNETSEVVKGSYVIVNEGATQASSAWVLSTAGSIVVGTTAQSWILFRDYSAANVNFTPAGTGATPRPAQDKMQETPSFGDFGSTLAKHQEAIDAHSNIFMAPGVATFSGGLILSGTDDKRIHGAGWGALFEHSGLDPLFTIGSTAGQQTADIRLVDFRADGNNSSPEFLDLKRQQSFSMAGVRANNFTGPAIRLDRCYSTKYIDFYLNNNGGGIHAGPFVDDGVTPAGNDFITVAFGNVLASSGDGIYIAGSCPSFCAFRIDLEGNNSATGTAALNIEAGSLGSHSAAVSVMSNYFENNHKLNVSIGAGSGAREVRGLIFTGNNVNPGSVDAATNAAVFDHVTNGFIAGNYFSGSNLVFSSSVSRMLVGPNYFAADSTDSVWGTDLPPIQYMHSAVGKDMVFGWRAVGWPLGHRAGLMRSGDVFSVAVNYSQVSGATTGCTPDDTGYGSVGIEIDTEKVRVLRAPAGVGTRTLAHGTPDIPVVVTASLPAASAFMDGQMIVEDTGAALNLIIYGAGIRSRINATVF